MRLEGWRKLKLKEALSVSSLLPLGSKARVAHVDGVLIRLHNDAQHLRSLQTLLVHQLLPNAQQMRERVLHDLVKLIPLLPALVSVHSADRKQTLESCIDVVRITRAEQLEGKLQEPGPSLGEIMLQDLLEEGHQLSANIWRCRGQGRDQSLAETGLLRVGNGGTLRAVFDGRPPAVDAVLQVNTG